MTASPSTWLADSFGELTPDAKCGAAGSQGLDLFDEYPCPWETSGNDEEPTRLTIRFETVPPRWKSARWWASLLIVVAAAVAGGRLVDARRLGARHHSQRLEPNATIVGRLPRVGSRARRRSPQSTLVDPGSGKHARHRADRTIRHQTAHTPRRVVPEVPVAAPPVASPPLAAGAERPEPHRDASPGQFSYLGQ